jgi:transcriptional regulator NrdR family protein
MVCIYCGGDTQVINSRLQKRLNHVWRRRKCLECGSVISTHESPDYAAAWRVKTKTSKLIPFSQNKLLISLYKSLEHRQTALSDAEGLLDTIISNLQPKTVQGVLQITEIIQITQETLNNFDNLLVCTTLRSTVLKIALSAKYKFSPRRLGY